ncbi:MAG: hypothetical protein M3P98_01525 [bacterium]|nr:hypothetical protein [bacterium]
MKDAFKKLTEEIKAEILATTKDFVEKTKEAASESGTFKFIISTDDVDRQGEVVDQKGWELDNYMANPIVLWAHDYKSLPIGIATSIKQEGNKLIAEGIFAPAEANPFAQQVRKLYDLGILRTTSVGFIAKEMQKNVITKAELLEFSVVPVPANAQALRINTMKEAGVDLEMMAMKGLELKEGEEEPTADEEDESGSTEPKEGDTCTLEDDTEGVLAPGEDGKLVCTPKPTSEEKGAVSDMDQFEKLLTETIGLLNAYATDPESEVSEETEVGKAVKAKKGDLLAILSKQLQGGAEKAGRVLSEKNRTTINEAIKGMKAGIAALDELLDATDEKGDEGKKGNGASPKIKRSSDAGSDEMEGLNSFLRKREVLREINNVTSNALANFNKKAKGKNK